MACFCVQDRIFLRFHVYLSQFAHTVDLDLFFSAITFTMEELPCSVQRELGHVPETTYTRELWRLLISAIRPRGTYGFCNQMQEQLCNLTYNVHGTTRRAHSQPNGASHCR